ncbi:MAG: transcriptional regulator, TraR/DksA family protein [Desulfamplus sp.]|nr:transcriptional regulator, TraR/DksA family protein [Desulfamplus sp.]
MKNSSQAECVLSGYSPSENEEYMNEKQLRYFQNRLLKQQRELEDILKISIKKLKTLKFESSDMIDQSNHESALFLELKKVERNTHLLQLNRNALTRIEKGYFGYCMLTGDAIGLKRLNLIPTTAMSIDAMLLYEEKMSMGQPLDMDFRIAS